MFCQSLIVQTGGPKPRGLCAPSRMYLGARPVRPLCKRGRGPTSPEPPGRVWPEETPARHQWPPVVPRPGSSRVPSRRRQRSDPLVSFRGASLQLRRRQEVRRMRQAAWAPQPSEHEQEPPCPGFRTVDSQPSSDKGWRPIRRDRFWHPEYGRSDLSVLGRYSLGCRLACEGC